LSSDDFWSTVVLGVISDGAKMSWRLEAHGGDLESDEQAQPETAPWQDVT
jgi:hypothetical protein